MFHVPESHLHGVKATKPFYLSVEYFYQDKTFREVWNVEMSFNLIGLLSINNKLKDEIRSAAIDHHLKHIS
jgi:hypothetical protein